MPRRMELDWPTGGAGNSGWTQAGSPNTIERIPYRLVSVRSEFFSWRVLLVSEVGAFEAKTHLPRLLKRVQQGERFVITRHNQPVAELVPYRQRDSDRVRAAIDGLQKFQRTHSLGGLSVRQMIDEGRRF